jgi:hypothetical protein
VHCDIHELLENRLQNQEANLAEIAAKVTEVLADLILMAPPDEQSTLMADMLANLGGFLLEKKEAADSTNPRRISVSPIDPTFSFRCGHVRGKGVHLRGHIHGGNPLEKYRSSVWRAYGRAGGRAGRQAHLGESNACITTAFDCRDRFRIGFRERPKNRLAAGRCGIRQKARGV